MSLPSIDRIRADVAMRVALHMQARQFLLPNVLAFAKHIVGKWSDQRCTLIYLLSNEENAFTELSRIARLMGCSYNAAAELWKGLRTLRIQLPTGEKVLLFRKDVDLSCHDGMNHAQERTISGTTLESTDTHAKNYNGSVERQAGMAEVPAEHAARVAEQKSVVIRGATGPQLALPVPMASNDGE
jgi:hypothetical protein